MSRGLNARRSAVVPTQGNEMFNIFSSCVETTRGVEFRHSKRNTSRICQKFGTEYLNTMFPMSTLLCAESSVKLKKKCMCQCTNIKRKTSTLN